MPKKKTKPKKPSAVEAARARLAALENAEIEYMIILGFFARGKAATSGERVLTALEHLGYEVNREMGAIFAGLVRDGTLVHAGVEEDTACHLWKLAEGMRGALAKDRARVERYLQRRIVAAR